MGTKQPIKKETILEISVRAAIIKVNMLKTPYFVLFDFINTTNETTRLRQ